MVAILEDMRKYRVVNLIGDTYQVESQDTVQTNDGDSIALQTQVLPPWQMEYQGSLSDCEAYIRLHEGGYM